MSNKRIVNIVVEGPSNTGKSALALFISDELKKQNVPVVLEKHRDHNLEEVFKDRARMKEILQELRLADVEVHVHVKQQLIQELRRS